MLTVLRNIRDPDVWISWEAVDSYDEIDGTTAGSGEDRE
jgi:hypothetical protein